jgi:nicotinate-nucleotide adenylyltransferase
VFASSVLELPLNMQAFSGARRVGVFGGTFDPPHNGHVSVAADVASATDLDRVLFVPASQPWQKSEYSPAEDRLIMTLLAARSDPRFAVSRIELDRTGPTYTLETMAALSALSDPAVRFFFILGVDAAINLDTWHRVEELADMTEILAVTRPGFDVGGLDDCSGRLRIQLVDVSPVDISATAVRTAVREGRPIDHLVPADVADYIRERGLYSGNMAEGLG